MFRSLRTPRVMAAALMLSTAGALAGVASSGALLATPRVVAHTPYPACTAAGLVNWLDTNANGTAGTMYYSLKFTNLSGHACTLLGYPGVSAVSLANTQIGAPATRNTSPVHPLVLINGGSVHATLGVTDVAFLSLPSCHPTTAAGLRVFAPNQTASKIIPFPIRVCGTPTSSVMRVNAVAS